MACVWFLQLYQFKLIKAITSPHQPHLSPELWELQPSLLERQSPRGSQNQFLFQRNQIAYWGLKSVAPMHTNDPPHLLAPCQCATGKSLGMAQWRAVFPTTTQGGMGDTGEGNPSIRDGASLPWHSSIEDMSLCCGGQEPPPTHECWKLQVDLGLHEQLGHPTRLSPHFSHPHRAFFPSAKLLACWKM